MQHLASRPLALTLSAAARALQISRSQAYVLAARGELPVVRVGQRMRVPVVALEEMLARRLEEARQMPQRPE